MKNKKFLFFIIIAFILSRIIYFFYFGIRFDTSPLDSYWQYIDPYLLKTDLLRSIYYLHSQPPLFNLFLGIVLKVFPYNHAYVFALCYFILGLIFTTTFFLIMVELGISDILAAILTSLFVISPSIILYENWLFYEYPVMVLLCCSLLFLCRFLTNRNVKDGIIFFVSLAFIVLMRSIFHILWFAAVVLILMFTWKGNRRKIIAACLIPFIAVSFFYLKNLYIFKTFSLGAVYIGQNIAKMTILSLPEDVRVSLLKKGKISNLSFIEIFSPISAYKPYVNIRQTGIPMLDQEYKSTGVVNAHNIGYLELSRRYLRDALYVIKNYPGLCLKFFYIQYKTKYFLPASNAWPFHEKYYNYERIRSFDKVYSFLFYGQLYYYDKALFLLVGMPFLFFYGIYLTFRLFSKKRDNVPLVSVLIFMLVTIVNVSFISVFTWENPRFCFAISFLYLIILGIFINSLLQKISEFRKR